MLFFVFTFIAGLIAVVLPLVIVRLMVRKWHIEPKIFWKTGIAGMLISFVLFGVTLNVDGAFPSFAQLPNIVQAFILGLSSGLFMELGKFFVLDRVMPKVRDRESGILFGIGWSGLGLIITGVFLMIGVFGMQNILNTKDFAAEIPNADADQIKFMQASQKEIQSLVNGPAYKAFSPVLEAAAMIIVDIAMTLLILLGLNKKRTLHAWIAVGVRSILATTLFYVGQTGVIPIEIVLAGWIVVGAILIFQLKKQVKAHA